MIARSRSGSTPACGSTGGRSDGAVADIIGVVLAALATCWVAYEAGRRHGAAEVLKTVEGALEPLLADGEPLPRDKGRFCCFSPGEEVKLRADPMPTLAYMSHIADHLVAAGMPVDEVQSALGDAVDEIADEVIDDWFRSRIATRLTEWQKEQAA